MIWLGEELSTNDCWPESLKLFDVTLGSPAENLALDEALLAAVEADASAACLRVWQSEKYFVVLGRSNSSQTEVHIEECAKLGFPILRRTTGGGTVLVGPGCLCYSLVLPLADIHRQMGISRLTAELMSKTAKGIGEAISPIEVCGTSDLVRNGLKFSGNAQRWLRQSFIHHGTVLFDFDLSLLPSCLGHPSREPAYRQLRRHEEFVTNIPMKPDDLKNCLAKAWNATAADCPPAILTEAAKIADTRYALSEWCISAGP